MAATKNRPIFQMLPADNCSDQLPPRSSGFAPHATFENRPNRPRERGIRFREFPSHLRCNNYSVGPNPATQFTRRAFFSTDAGPQNNNTVGRTRWRIAVLRSHAGRKRLRCTDTFPTFLHEINATTGDVQAVTLSLPITDMTVDPLSGKLFGMTPIPGSLLEPAAIDPVTGAVTDVLPPGVNIQPTVTAALSALDLDHLVRVVGQRL